MCSGAYFSPEGGPSQASTANLTSFWESVVCRGSSGKRRRRVASRTSRGCTGRASSRTPRPRRSARGRGSGTEAGACRAGFLASNLLRGIRRARPGGSVPRLVRAQPPGDPSISISAFTRRRRSPGIESPPHIEAISCLRCFRNSACSRQGSHEDRCRSTAARTLGSSSPSRKRAISRSVSWHSGPQSLSTDKSSPHGHLEQRLLQCLSSPVQTRHHGPDRHVHDLRDLLVAEAL